MFFVGGIAVNLKADLQDHLLGAVSERACKSLQFVSVQVLCNMD